MPTQHADAGLQRGEPAVWQAGGLEGDGEEIAVGGLEGEEDGLVGRPCLVKQGREDVRDRCGENDPSHGLSQSGEFEAETDPRTEPGRDGRVGVERIEELSRLQSFEGLLEEIVAWGRPLTKPPWDRRHPCRPSNFVFS